MTLVGHLLRTDSRRLARLMIAWLVIVITIMILEVVIPTVASVRAQEVLQTVLGLLRIAENLVLILFVVSAIHLHPLVGTDAFWLTRPVPPLSLLVEKIVLLWCGIVLLLVSTNVIAMTVYGVSVRTMTLVSIQTALRETLWLSLVMAAAALTLNLTGFAMLCGGVIAASAVLLSLAFTAAMAGIAFKGRAMFPSAADPDGTKVILMWALMVCAAVMLLVVQYRTRSRLRSVAAGGVALAAAVTITTFWNVPLLARPSQPPSWAMDDAAARLVPDWSTAKLSGDTVPFFNEDRAWRTLRARVRVDSLPPFWSARVFLLHGTVQLADGTTLSTPTTYSYGTLSLMGALERGAYDAVADLMAVRQLFGRMDVQQEECTLFVAPQNAFGGDPVPEVRYDGRFIVELTRYEIEGTMLLTRGEVHHADDHRIAIRRIATSGRSVAVMVSESQAASPFSHRRNEYSFYLRNQKLGQAVAGYADEIFGGGLPLAMLPMSSVSAEGNSGFNARGRILRFPAGMRPDGEQSPLDSVWLADAELVIVRSAVEGSVQRTLRSDRLVLLASAR